MAVVHDVVHALAVSMEVVRESLYVTWLVVLDLAVDLLVETSRRLGDVYSVNHEVDAANAVVYDVVKDPVTVDQLVLTLPDVEMLVEVPTDVE